MLSRIVVGTDGSQTAAEAVRHARELAQAAGATLEIVSAYAEGEPPDPATAYDPTVQEGPEKLHLPGDVPRAVGAREEVSGIVDAETTEAAKAGVEEINVHTIKGDPADVIISVAEETGADLIVVGNKGMSGARRFVLGSVPDKISHHAPCSVYIVRTT